MSIKPEVIRGDELTLDMFHDALSSIVPAKAHLIAGGKTYSQPELLAKVDEVRSPLKAKRSAKTALRNATAEVKSKRPEIHRFVKFLHTAIKAFLGDESADIVKFGFKPDKVRQPLTSEQEQHRVEQARRTRKKNRTMGRLQKKRFDASADSGDPPSGDGAAPAASPAAK